MSESFPDWNSSHGILPFISGREQSIDRQDLILSSFSIVIFFFPPKHEISNNTIPYNEIDIGMYLCRKNYFERESNKIFST